MHLYLISYFFVKIYSEIFHKLESDEHWESYKKQYSLEFEAEEDHKRKSIFEQNLKYINQHNNKENSFKLDINKFTHLTKDEFGGRSKLIKTVVLPDEKIKKVKKDHPLTSIDWRRYGVVSPVVNQGDCGSCYAHSGVGAIESHVAIKTRLPLVLLSIQELVDCSESEGNQGCYGGYPQGVFQYAMGKGISRNNDYKYVGKDQQCLVKKSFRKTKITSYKNVLVGDEDDIIEVLSRRGPVSVAMDSRPQEIQFYKSGIIDFNGCSQTTLDHAVIIVGFDLTGSVPYFIVKNSWGPEWGENGYFRIRIYQNMCGISSDASYPIA